VTGAVGFADGAGAIFCLGCRPDVGTWLAADDLPGLLTYCEGCGGLLPLPRSVAFARFIDRLHDEAETMAEWADSLRAQGPAAFGDEWPTLEAEAMAEDIHPVRDALLDLAFAWGEGLADGVRAPRGLS
jgi:hypothetical protein